MNTVVVGAGLIGGRRARVASSQPGTTVALVVDVDEEKASELGRELGCGWGTDWKMAVDDGDMEVVVVATPNNLLAPVAIAALEAGKHVLVEKPMATRVEDAKKMVERARANGLILAVGYTLRHHAAVRKAKELLDRGAIGMPLYVRACYGHGGRPGYESEWRFVPGISGGGELIDQGVHLIDLSRWFLGDFSEVTAMVSTSFWDVSPLEDNAFLTMRGPGGGIAHLHASCTQWRNRFLFEIFGKGGYLILEGLGGSYGRERLTVGIRDAENPPPEEETFAFDENDEPWRREWESFIEMAGSGTGSICTGSDGLASLRLARAAYRAAREKKTVAADG